MSGEPPAGSAPEETSMFHRRVHAIVVGVVLLAIATSMAIVIGLDPTGSILQPPDDRWLAWMIDIRTAWLTDLAKAVSFVGSVRVIAPVRLAILAVLAVRRRWLQAGAFLGAVVTSELCTGPLKALIDRPRPPDPLVDTSSASFPSGHAIAASVTALALVVVLVPPGRRRTRWTVAAALFAAMVAMSRTYLAAHWASDVVAGAAIGTGLALLWPAALELIRARVRRRSS
jgi:membrane-associated phospholipid phosphatase